MLTSRYAMWMAWGAGADLLLQRRLPADAGRQAARGRWARLRHRSGRRSGTRSARASETVHGDRRRPPGTRACCCSWSAAATPRRPTTPSPTAPCRDDAGAVGGMLCVVTEETERVIGERRLRARCASSRPSSPTTSTERDGRRRRAAQPARQRPRGPAVRPALSARARGRRRAAGRRRPASRPAQPGGAGGDRRSTASRETWPIARAAGARGAACWSTISPPASATCPPAPGTAPPRRAIARAASPSRARSGRPASWSPASTRTGRSTPTTPASSTWWPARSRPALANARAYEEERRRAEALAELDRAKTAFFSNVSHEFRTPLTLMLGPLEDAPGRGTSSAPDRPRAGWSSPTATRCGCSSWSTRCSTSRASRPAASQASYEPADLAAFTADLASSFRSAMRARRAGTSTVDCPPLPEPVYVDRDMWEKIVLNLLSNAFKFTFEGGDHGPACAARRPDGRARGARHRHRHPGSRAAAPVRALPPRRGRSAAAPTRAPASAWRWCRSWCGCTAARSSVESAVGPRHAPSRSRVPFGTAHLPADRIGAAPRARPPPPPAPTPSSRRRCAGCPDRRRTAPGDAAGRQCAAGRRAGARPAILLADDNADMRDYVRRLLAARATRSSRVADGAGGARRGAGAQRARPRAVAT